MPLLHELRNIVTSVHTRVVTSIIGVGLTGYGLYRFWYDLRTHSKSKVNEYIWSTLISLSCYVCAAFAYKNFGKKTGVFVNFACTICGLIFAAYMGAQLQNHSPTPLLLTGGGLMMLSLSRGLKNQRIFEVNDFGGPGVLVALAMSQLKKKGNAVTIYIELIGCALIVGVKDIVVPGVNYLLGLVPGPINVNNTYLQLARQQPNDLRIGTDDLDLKLDVAVMVLNEMNTRWGEMNTRWGELRSILYLPANEDLNVVCQTIQLERNQIRLILQLPPNEGLTVLCQTIGQLKTFELERNEIRSFLQLPANEDLTSLSQTIKTLFELKTRRANALENMLQTERERVQTERERVAELENSLQSERERVAELENSLQSERERVQTERERVAELENSLQSERERVAELENSLQSERERVAEWENWLNW